MKRIVCLLLMICLLIPLLSACAPDDTTIKIGVLNGPTAMGALKMWADADPRYEFKLYGEPRQILSDIAAGDLDIAALPTNNAASYYNQHGKDIRVVALNTLGVLYLLDGTGTITSLADLEGKTVYVPNPGSNPEYIFRHILDKTGINAIVETVPAPAQVPVENGIGVLPQPAATARALAAKSEGNILTAVDLSVEWNKIESTPIAQGCLIASADFCEKNPDALGDFLEAYRASVAFMTAPENIDAAAELVVTKEILPKVPVAKQALPKCAITYLDGEEMKAALDAFYAILYEYNPDSIGGAIPDAGFYYDN